MQPYKNNETMSAPDMTARQIRTYVEEFNCPDCACTDCEIFDICCRPLNEWNLEEEIKV